MLHPVNLISSTNTSFQVPGRLGLLITLDLIASNVYNSVKGPDQRGFSYIEIWNLGVQFPILLAIFEFGVILGIKRYQQNCIYKAKTIKVTSSKIGHLNVIGKGLNDWNVDQIARVMDMWTFIGSATFIIIFNAVYWSVAEFKDPEA